MKIIRPYLKERKLVFPRAEGRSVIFIIVNYNHFSLLNMAANLFQALSSIQAELDSIARVSFCATLIDKNL
jgi:hypothetical protein